jgi:hypothetical protein
MTKDYIRILVSSNAEHPKRPKFLYKVWSVAIENNPIWCLAQPDKSIENVSSSAPGLPQIVNRLAMAYNADSEPIARAASDPKGGVNSI